MDNQDKIRISYEELADSKIDEIIKKTPKSGQIKERNDSRIFPKMYINTAWVYLLILALIASLIIWYLTNIIFKESNPKNNYHDMYTSLIEVRHLNDL